MSKPRTLATSSNLIFNTNLLQENKYFQIDGWFNKEIRKNGRTSIEGGHAPDFCVFWGSAANIERFSLCSNSCGMWAQITCSAQYCPQVSNYTLGFQKSLDNIFRDLFKDVVKIQKSNLISLMNGIFMVWSSHVLNEPLPCFQVKHLHDRKRKPERPLCSQLNERTWKSRFKNMLCGACGVFVTPLFPYTNCQNVCIWFLILNMISRFFSMVF